MTESVDLARSSMPLCDTLDVRTVRAEPDLVFWSSGGRHTCAHLPGSCMVGRSWGSPTRPAACPRS